MLTQKPGILDVILENNHFDDPQIDFQTPWRPHSSKNSKNSYFPG